MAKTLKKKPGSSPNEPQQAKKRIAKRMFRLLPITTAMCFGLLSLKMVEVYQQGTELKQAFCVGNVMAEEETPPTETMEIAQAETDGAEGVNTDADTGSVDTARPTDILEQRDSEFTAREAEVLQSLAQRREKLETWEKEIALREKLLEATEDRIENKLAEMETLSEQIQELLVAYNDEEDAKISSLVKIYEAMKPKEAARIFDQLNMDVLLMVVDRMSERRVAPVLANMSPAKAKEVTQELADQRKLNTQPQMDAIDPTLLP